MRNPRYLLDTNILSSLIKHPSGPVVSRITAVGDETVCTSIVVACELRYGAVKKGAPILVRKVERLLDSIEVLHTLSLGLTLVTDNLSEFSRVPDLTVENWLAGPDPA